ncbi:MAG: CDP-archaeol synthase, partial [Candidatus Woesearchaeota archaeon]
GVFAAVVAGLAMWHTYWPFEFSGLKWALAAGIGALLGDSIKSFFKRRLGILPGRPWIPFDQVDYAIGALAAGSFVFFPGWLNAFVIVLISFAGHIAANHVAFWLGIRGEKW